MTIFFSANGRHNLIRVRVAICTILRFPAGLSIVRSISRAALSAALSLDRTVRYTSVRLSVRSSPQRDTTWTLWTLWNVCPLLLVCLDVRVAWSMHPANAGRHFAWSGGQSPHVLQLVSIDLVLGTVPFIVPFILYLVLYVSALPNQCAGGTVCRLFCI